jgi:uncharacterized protein
MPYLIDGHNLIPKIPSLSLRNVDDEIALVKLLQSFCQRTGKKVEVYFDNAPPGYAGTRKYGNVTAHFVQAGTTADNAIRHRLSRLKGAAKNWIVVSSDRQVQAEARGMRAQVIPSEGFATELIQDKNTLLQKSAPMEKLTPEEVDEWLEIFSKKK